jgi:hypothetical protein
MRSLWLHVTLLVMIREAAFLALIVLAMALVVGVVGWMAV